MFNYKLKTIMKNELFILSHNLYLNKKNILFSISYLNFSLPKEKKLLSD